MIDVNSPSVYVTASTEKSNHPAEGSLLGSGTLFRPNVSDTNPTLTYTVDATGDVTVRKVTLSVKRGDQVILTISGGATPTTQASLF